MPGAIQNRTATGVQPQDASRTAYQRYLDEHNQMTRSYAGEGSAPGAQTYDQWFGDQSKAAKWGFEHGYDTVDPRTMGVALRDDDPLIQQFKDRYGTRNYANVELNNQALTGYEVISPDDVEKLKEWGTDTSRLMDLGDGRYLMERNNRSGDAIAAAQARDADSGYFHGDAWDILKGPGFVLGAGMLGNALMGAGALGAGEVAIPGLMEPLAPTTVGSMGAAPTITAPGAAGAAGSVGGGGSLGAGSLGLGSGATSVGTGLGAGLDLGTSITGVGGLPAATGGAGVLPGAGTAVAGAVGTGTGNAFIDGLRDAWTRFSTGSGPVLPTGGGSMDWTDIIRAGLDLFGQSRQPNMQQAAGQDREYNERMWQRALEANRPNQETPWMTSQWSQDPQTGRWTQRQSLNAQDQQRLDQYRNIAAGRMNDAGHLAQFDWSKINPRVAQMVQGVSFGGNQLRGG